MAPSKGPTKAPVPVPTPKPAPTYAPTGSGTCPKTCWGTASCDQISRTCSDLTTNYGCDCTGCKCTNYAPGEPTPTPTWMHYPTASPTSGTCPENINLGDGYKSCDQLADYFTCAELELSYSPYGGHYDCSGCKCNTGVNLKPTNTPTAMPTNKGAVDWTDKYTTSINYQGTSLHYSLPVLPCTTPYRYFPALL